MTSNLPSIYTCPEDLEVSGGQNHMTPGSRRVATSGRKSANRNFAAAWPCTERVETTNPTGSGEPDLWKSLIARQKDANHSIIPESGRRSVSQCVSLECWFHATDHPATPWTERAGALSPAQMQRTRKEKVQTNRPAPIHTMTTWTSALDASA